MSAVIAEVRVDTSRVRIPTAKRTDIFEAVELDAGPVALSVRGHWRGSLEDRSYIWPWHSVNSVERLEMAS